MADSEDRWGGGGRSLMAVSVAIVTDGLWKFHDGFWTKVFSLGLAMCVCVCGMWTCFCSAETARGKEDGCSRRLIQALCEIESDRTKWFCIFCFDVRVDYEHSSYNFKLLSLICCQLCNFTGCMRRRSRFWSQMSLSLCLGVYLIVGRSSSRIIEIGGNNAGLDFRKCSGNRTCSSDVILHVLVNSICLRLHLARSHWSR